MADNGSDTSALCNLILAQLVYELGESDYGVIADQLNAHPLLQADKSLPDTPEACKELYDKLLEGQGLERDPPEFDPKLKKPPAWVEKVAQVMYMAYTDQLLGQIKHDEAEFKQHVKELEEIKSGAWDDRL